MKNILFLIGGLAIASCSQRIDKKESKPVSVDSLNAIFVASWNTKDSIAAVSIIADNAIVMNDSLVYKGVDEIAKK